MVKTKQQLVTSRSKTYGGKNGKKYITIHETANTSRGADAQAHANLQTNGFSSSWHWSVDDKQAIQSFPHDAQCWHAGDGRGDGNLNSIGIEICVNSDGDFKKAVANAAELVKKIMKEENITLSNVVQHHHWSRKNCPTNLRNGSKGINWQQFLNTVKEGSASESSTSSTQTYTVIPGDTLSAIANKHNTTVDDLVKLNGIKNKNHIEIGQKIKVSSGSAAKPAPAKPSKPIGPNLTVDGKWGASTTRVLQQALGTPVDGVISNQRRNSVSESLYGGVTHGTSGSIVIAALQRKIGARGDGLLGPATIRALQQHLGTVVDGKLSRPSLVVKEMQRRLNKGTF